MTVNNMSQEERDAQLREDDGEPRIRVDRVRCHCGKEAYAPDPFWMRSGDQIEIACGDAHTSILRFLPETV